jgi:hypothetical protein
LRAAAALFLRRQHLDWPRARLTAASLTRFAEDAGGISSIRSTWWTAPTT